MSYSFNRGAGASRVEYDSKGQRITMTAEEFRAKAAAHEAELNKATNMKAGKVKTSSPTCNSNNVIYPRMKAPKLYNRKSAQVVSSLPQSKLTFPVLCSGENGNREN